MNFKKVFFHLFSVTWCEWKPVHFCFKSNLWNVGKKSPFELKKMHTQIVTRPFNLIGCGLSGYWIVCILVLDWAVQNLKTQDITILFIVCTHIRTERVLDLTLELYLGSCQSLPFAFYECFRHCRYQNLDRLIWRKKLGFFENSTYVFWRIKVTK